MPRRWVEPGDVLLVDGEPVSALYVLLQGELRIEKRGVQIATNVNGSNLDDPSLAPFYAKAQELDVPIFIHPNNVLGTDRLRSYHLANLIGKIRNAKEKFRAAEDHRHLIVRLVSHSASELSHGLQPVHLSQLLLHAAALGDVPLRSPRAEQQPAFDDSNEVVEEVPIVALDVPLV